MAACSIKRTRDYIFVWSQWITSRGAGRDASPVIRLERDSEARLIGKSVLLALAGCREGVSDAAERWKAEQKEHVRFHGFSSWKEMAVSTAFAAAWVEGDGLLVEISRLGEKSSVVPTGVQPLRSALEERQIGETVLTALELFGLPKEIAAEQLEVRQRGRGGEPA